VARIAIMCNSSVLVWHPEHAGARAAGADVEYVWVRVNLPYYL